MIKQLSSFIDLKNWIIKNFKYILILTIAFKFLFAFLYGTQDVEWWKAWYSSIEEKGILNVYGVTDNENIKLLKQGLSFEEVRKKTQNVIKYEAYKYERKNFVVTQPPVYLYHIFLAGKMYKIIDPNLTNNRLYNFFLNLFPIIYSILTCFLIYYFLNSTQYKEHALVSAIFCSLNPLIILNSPIQGFWDPILGFYVLTSFIFLYKRKITTSFIFFTIAILVKPTAIIIIPVYLLFIIKEHSCRQILKSIFISLLVFLFLVSPFIFSNHFISMSLGVHSILDSSNDISRQSLNIWWPLQYYLNFYKSNSHGLINFIIGKDFIWYEDFSTQKISSINLKLLSTILFTIATILNLYNASKYLLKNRVYIFYFAFIQIYIYFMLRIGVQNNHYYMMLVFCSVICFFSKEMFRTFLIVILIFFTQDFIFYGLGRDFSLMLGALNFLNLPFITVILSLLNFLFFLKILLKPIKI
jgi:Gpi18-like mannosyltransferase